MLLASAVDPVPLGLIVNVVLLLGGLCGVLLIRSSRRRAASPKSALQSATA
ncbi:hypothetical protein LWC33_23705 [Pseudonocardia sp. RS11V-5]|uniref:hypothetical protein n=1 Tax=Pseudonocardia terrae TaxID=2905831 RepID=UPI001E473100|nr:hypothetical protein [Pseudonocardia terrae]MCE3554449.1 hypothetical protein [Pseudonocardia terrae]